MHNILLAGVGGQGLVLTTGLICQAAMNAGLDVKSNDVVGLSQRGGRVWGNVRIGERVYSPNVPYGQGDFLLAMEPLEGLRWAEAVKLGGWIFVNTRQVPPVPVIAEKEIYPTDILKKLEENYQVVAIDAVEEGLLLGNPKIANTFLVGMLASRLEISKDHWLKAIEDTVPPKAIELNKKAFEIGYQL